MSSNHNTINNADAIRTNLNNLSPPLNTCYKCKSNIAFESSSATDRSNYIDKSAYSFIQFSCNHKLCITCISRYFLEKTIKSISNTTYTKLQLQCPSCSSGFISMETKEFLIFLQNMNVQPTIKKCKKHWTPSDFYCCDCKSWWCDLCIPLHDELVDGHSITSKDTRCFEICPKHKKEEVQWYCKDCKTEICKACTNENEKHKNHQVKPFTSYYSKINDNFQFLKFPNLDEFERDFKERVKSFTDSYEKEIQRRLREYEEMLNHLHEQKEAYIIDMENKKKNVTVLFNIIKLCFKRFYLDYTEKYPNVYTLKHLSKMKEVFNELVFVNDIYGDFEWIYSQIFRFKHEKTFWFNIIFYQGSKGNDNALNNNDIQTQRSVLNNLNKSECDWIYTHNTLGKQNINGTNTIQATKLSSSSKEIKTTWKTVSNFRAHSALISSLLKLTNGFLVTGGKDKLIRIWNIIQNKMITTLIGHNSDITALIETKKRNLVSSSNDCSIKVWDLISYKETLNVVTTHPIYSLLELKNCQVAAGSNSSINIWKLQISKNEICLIGHEDLVNCIIQWSDSRLASCSNDSKIFIWDITDVNEVYEINAHNGSVNKIAVLNGSSRFVSCGDDMLIKVWDYKTRKIVFSLTGHKREVSDICCSNDGRWWSCGRDGIVKIWDIIRKREIFSLKSCVPALLRIIQFESDWILTGAQDGIVRLCVLK